MKFIDRVRVKIRAGDGGPGALSFLREKFKEFGGPDGGNGGRGGSVLFVADENVGTLLDFAFRPRLVAGNGVPGKGGNKTGADAEDLLVRVPLGTVVYKDGRPIADLAKSGDSVCAAAGGRGGRGNLSFKTRFRTAPRVCEKGEPGEAAEVALELKLIADIGLVGFPNAGKSTMLARLSNARPKVADYPFTTLSPNLGLVKHKGASFVLADIPGLIEGAHAGKGLGGEFLRHVERTRILVHMIDPMGFDGISAVDGVKKIEEELKKHSRALGAKPRILAVNKQDLPEGARALKSVKGRYRKRKVFAVSAATGEGLSALIDAALRELKKAPRYSPEIAVESGGPRSVKIERGFHIERTGQSSFRIIGKYIERVAAMSEPGLVESMYRLQKTLGRVGVDRGLRGVGVREGDLIRIGPLELEWTDAAPKRPPKLSKRGRL